jgi:hypothetical protein
MVASGHRDPQDPDGRLSLPPNRWASDANGSYKTACENAFNQTNAQFRPYILNAFNALNRGPYAFSAGKDKNYRTEDDLYSFRIARDNKGN